MNNTASTSFRDFLSNLKDPVDTLLTALRDHGQEVRESGDGWVAQCPAHDDANPSLSIGRGADGRALINCHAGCKPEDVLGSIGLAWGDVFSTGYVYENENGEPGHVVFREDLPNGKKEIRQGHLDPGTGKFVWGKGPSTPPPFNVMAVVDSINKQEPVFVVEGEKCAWALTRLGLAATCNPGGAGKWKPELSKHFKGANVVILPDNDEPGRKHAAQVAQSLHGVAARVRVLELPDLPPKGDVVDWLEDGNDEARLLDLVKQAPDSEPPPNRIADRELSWSDAMQIPPPRWVIDGILQEAPVSYVYGDRGSYKSFIVLDWALHCALGEPWQGFKTTKEQVLYVAAEGSGGLGVRARAWCAAHGRSGPAREDLAFYPGALNLLVGADVEEIIDYLKRWPKTLVVFDTLRRSMAGGNENDQRDAGLLVSNAGRIHEETGAKTLLIHHTNKGGGFRGSSVFEADGDNSLKIGRRDSGNTRTAMIGEEGTGKTKDGAEVSGLIVVLERFELDTTGPDGEEGPPSSSLAVVSTEWAPGTRRLAAAAEDNELWGHIRDLAGDGLTQTALVNRAVELSKSPRANVRKKVEELLESGLLKIAPDAADKRRRVVRPGPGLLWALRQGSSGDA